MTEHTQPIILVDSFAQIFRCYYAVRSLSNKNGDPTNAIFGMMRFLLKLEEMFPGAKGAFVFDKGKPPHRLKLAPDYKANRPPTPEDLLAQIPHLRHMIRAFGWNIVEADNTEADDLIASIALHFEQDPVRIISADKDISQIINSRIEMLVPDQAGKGFAKRGIAEAQEKFGVAPEAIIDYLAMIGDSADNIPGIAGVGPKTAAQLLNRFGSIANMLEHAHEIERETLRTKIVEGSEILLKNIELVRLVTDPPEGISWSDATIVRNPVDMTQIRAIAEINGFRSVQKDIDKLADAIGRNTDSLFATPSPETENTPPGKEKEWEQPSLF